MTRPAVLDWRNRWGINWVTAIRDQNPCQACWAFCTTALVESRVRIEHAVWSVQSEGDVHKGMGALCAHTGSEAGALDWMNSNGIADPECFAWTSADVAYTPSPDRSGRTVRRVEKVRLTNVDDQKNWLDLVGPITGVFEVWADFGSVGRGIYRKVTFLSPGVANFIRGLHCVLIVGYDDTQNCWIAKNSWGSAGFGENGFFRIAYGQVKIDDYAKFGLRFTNPDPWTKRRLHSGNIIESGNGGFNNNFEILATGGNGKQIRHWWRDNARSGFPWAQAALFANDAAVCPTFTATTYNRNFELVYLTTGRRLHHWFFDQASRRWIDGGIFGPSGDAYGVPGLIQSNFGTPGNFEVVVKTTDGKLNHWWRMNGPPWTWNDGGRFGEDVMFSGPSLIQSHFGRKGSFELVCVLNNGQMQHWWRNNDDPTFPWITSVTFGSDVISPPCMIEGQYGASDEFRAGNFELCVAVKGGRIQHWWRDNQGGRGWSNSATFGQNVNAVVGLIEGSFGFNLEVIALRTDNQLQHYWRDGSGWHAGVVIGPA
jgi:hypothetical protein